MLDGNFSYNFKPLSTECGGRWQAQTGSIYTLRAGRDAWIIFLQITMYIMVHGYQASVAVTTHYYFYYYYRQLALTGPSCVFDRMTCLFLYFHRPRKQSRPLYLQTRQKEIPVEFFCPLKVTYSSE